MCCHGRCPEVLSIRKKAALALSSLLAKNHIPVVSGLALGIDGFSHEGALLEGDM